MRHLRLDQRVQLILRVLQKGEAPMMKRYSIEFIRHVPGRKEPEVIDVRNMKALGIGDVIDYAADLLRTGFRVPADTFRVRANGGQIVYAPAEQLLLVG
jgi:hypothetical protein